MLSFKFHHVIFFFFFLTINARSDSSFSFYRCLPTNSNSSSRTFQTNLNLLLSSLISKAPSSSGYYIDHVGEKPNRVHGLVLCRGDVQSNQCLNCLINVTNDITQHCMDSTQGIVWHDYCLVRYNNHDFFGAIDTGRFFQNQNWTRQEYPDADPERLIRGLVESAPSQPLMFAANKLEVKRNYLSESETRYGLVQCTRDLTRNGCRSCLNELMKDYRLCCEGMREWRIVTGSCSIWYDDYPPSFFGLAYRSSLRNRMLQEKGNEITYGVSSSSSVQKNLSSPAPQPTSVFKVSRGTLIVHSTPNGAPANTTPDVIFNPNGAPGPATPPLTWQRIRPKTVPALASEPAPGICQNNGL